MLLRLSIVAALITATSTASSQTVSSFGWNNYSNWSGTLQSGPTVSGNPGAGQHYSPAISPVTIVGPSVTTSLVAVNGPLSIPTQQNYVLPAGFTGIYNSATVDGLEWGDNHSNTTGTGLWHTSTLGFSSLLTMTGAQTIGFNGATIDFDGFMIVHSGDTHSITLDLTGGGVFSGVNFLGGYSDTYSLSGTGTSSVTLSWTGSETGIAAYVPVISGSFDSLSVTQSNMSGVQSTSEPLVYYRSESASIVAVPEPSGTILVGAVGLLAVLRRRRHII
jgi:hypothetical protein